MKNSPQQYDLDFTLILESANGHLSEIRKLLFLGANPNCEIDMHTPLAASSANGHINVINELLKAGANPNACDGLAISYASSNGHIPVIDILIKNGADINSKGGSPLISAGLYDKFDAFKYLLEKGADFELAMANIHHKEVKEKIDNAYSKLLAAQEENLIDKDLIEVVKNKKETEEPSKPKGLRV